MATSAVRLSTQSRLLISDQVLRKICDIFFDLFLSAYMYKISDNNGIFYLSMYNIISWITVCILVFPVSRIITRYNKVWIYRLGVAIKLSIILLVALLGPSISSLFWLVGILNGIMIAFNGYIVNYFESENVPKNELVRYIGIGNAFSSLANTIVPIVLGSSIFIGSFEVTALALSAIVALELLICFGIKGYRPKERRKLNYHRFLKIAFHDKNYRSLCFQQLLSGINRNGVMSLLVSILIFQSVDNELSLGGWTSIFGLTGVVAMLLFAHFYKNRYRKISQLLFGTFVILGCVPLLIEVNFLNIIIFNIIFYTFVRAMEKIVHLDLVSYSKTKKYHEKYLQEFFSVREVFLTIGRVIGYGSLALIPLFNLGVSGLRGVFVIILASIALMGLTSAHFNPNKINSFRVCRATYSYAKIISMQNEIEAQFLDINKDEIRTKLKSIGAKCVKPEIKMKRVIFDAGPHQFIRVRDEGDKIVMTYKNIENDKDIQGTKEVNLVVDDYDKAVDFMKGTHLKIKARQETLREVWTYKDVEICIDTWPWIPSFIEIEGPDEASVWRTAEKLDLDKSSAKFGSVDSTYNHYYGVECDIVNLHTPIITFNCELPDWVDPEIMAKIITTR